MTDSFDGLLVVDKPLGLDLPRRRQPSAANAGSRAEHQHGTHGDPRPARHRGARPRRRPPHAAHRIRAAAIGQDLSRPGLRLWCPSATPTTLTGTIPPYRTDGTTPPSQRPRSNTSLQEVPRRDRAGPARLLRRSRHRTPCLSTGTQGAGSVTHRSRGPRRCHQRARLRVPATDNRGAMWQGHLYPLTGSRPGRATWGAAPLIETLRRTRVGCFGEEVAIAPDADRETAQGRLLPLSSAVSALPHWSWGQRKSQGSGWASTLPIENAGLTPGVSEIAVFDEAGVLVAVAGFDPERRVLSPSKVIPV